MAKIYNRTKDSFWSYVNRGGGKRELEREGNWAEKE